MNTGVYGRRKDRQGEGNPRPEQVGVGPDDYQTCDLAWQQEQIHYSYSSLPTRFVRSPTHARAHSVDVYRRATFPRRPPPATIQEMSSSQDAALQDLIKDSIIRILEHEDPGQYFKWIRSAFPTYGLTPTDRARDEDAQRVMAMGIGRAIWNATPLPGNGFRPRPLPRPGRNDRCPCGSGKKHKKCCGLSGSLPDPQIDVETILPIVLSLASPQQRSAMVKSQRLPITVLVETARDHLEEGHP